jgi:copper chaperone CopZ
MSSTDQRNYSVAGMTCDHCVISVREEVFEVAGVTESWSIWPPGS